MATDDQARRARNGVVDARRDARVLGLRRAQHRRGERRDQQRQASPRTSDRRQHIGNVAGAGPDAQQQQHAGGGDQRSEGHRQARTDASGELARARREQQHDHRDRQQRGAREERREAGDHLQVRPPGRRTVR